MIVRCWGARGSIPVSGEEYLKYGGDTTCIEIRTKNDDIIIIDAGTGIRRLGIELMEEPRTEINMIFTHAHWDHLMGFPFFRPLYFSNTRINMLGCPFAQATIKDMISRVMTSPNFPVNYEDLKAEISYEGGCEGSFSISSVTVIPIFLSHPNGGNGYKFIEDGSVFVFLTDNELTYRHAGGLFYDDYLRFSENADLLIHDAEYTKADYKKTRAWGHSVYEDALKLAIEGNVKKLGLFHHNQDRTDNGIDEIVKECRNTVKNNGHVLECFAVDQEMTIEI